MLDTKIGDRIMQLPVAEAAREAEAATTRLREHGYTISSIGMSLHPNSDSALEGASSSDMRDALTVYHFAQRQSAPAA